MSVTSVNELTTDRSVALEEKELKEGKPNGYSITYTRTFRVQVDSPSTSIKDVLYATGIPKLGKAHPDQDTAFCRNKRAEPEGDGRQSFIVTCEYRCGDDRYDEDIEDLTDKPPEITFGSVQYTRVATLCHKCSVGPTGDHTNCTLTDVVTNPTQKITNSAAQLFEQPYTYDDFLTTITITRNLATFNPNDIYTYKNTVNANQMYIAGLSIGKRCARMRDFRASKKWDTDNDEYWEVTWEIEVDPRSFVVKLIDQGVMKYVDGNYYYIKDADDLPLAVPVNFDGYGVPLLYPTTTDPVKLGFHIFHEQDWKALPLPTSVYGY